MNDKLGCPARSGQLCERNCTTACAMLPGKHSHYFKPVGGLTHVDVYRVLSLFNVTDPCIQHAIKKLLVAGGRGGGKDISRDVQEAIDTMQRWQEMRAEDGGKLGRALQMDFAEVELRVHAREKPPIAILYRNHRDEIEWREIVPNQLTYSKSVHYPEPQWLLVAFCRARNALRTFALANIMAISSDPVADGVKYGVVDAKDAAHGAVPATFPEALEEPMDNFQRTRAVPIGSTLAWFAAAGQMAIPEEVNVRQTAFYIGMQMEELGEKLELVLGANAPVVLLLKEREKDFKSGFYDEIVGNALRANPELMLDADMDLIWVSIGGAMAQGADVGRAYAEVGRANWDKFPNGVAIRDGQGKVVKPEGWKAPDHSGNIHASLRPEAA